MTEQELTPGNFFTKVKMPVAPIDREAIKQSRDRIFKMIVKLTRELRQSKNLQLRHSKEVKIDSLKLILEYYDKIRE